MTIRTQRLAGLRPLDLLRRSTVLLLTLFMLAAAGCDSSDPVDDDDDPPPATTGTITGTVTLPPGTNGSVSNARVALFADQGDYFSDSFAYQTAVGGDGTFTISNIVPGTYYMDVWKDNNNNGAIGDGGDFYGVYGTLTGGAQVNLTPIPVAAGQTETIPVTITQCPPAGCF